MAGQILGPFQLISRVPGYSSSSPSVLCYVARRQRRAAARSQVLMKVVDLSADDSSAGERELKEEQRVLSHLYEHGVDGIIREHGIHYTTNSDQPLQPASARADEESSHRDDGVAMSDLRQRQETAAKKFVGLALSQVTAVDSDPLSANWTTLSEHVKSCKNGHMDQKMAMLCYLAIATRVTLIHNERVALFDLKLSDVAFNTASQDLVLTNFSAAKILPEYGAMVTLAGSGGPYQAPEMTQGEPYNAMIADIWSLGVMMYEMVCGYLPHDQNLDDAELRASIFLENDWVVPGDINMHEYIENIISVLASVDPANRAFVSAADLTEEAINLLDRDPSQGLEESEEEEEEDEDLMASIPLREPPATVVQAAGMHSAESQLAQLVSQAIRPVFLPPTLRNHGSASQDTSQS